MSLSEHPCGLRQQPFKMSTKKIMFYGASKKEDIPHWGGASAIIIGRPQTLVSRVSNILPQLLWGFKGSYGVVAL